MFFLVSLLKRIFYGVIGVGCEGGGNLVGVGDMGIWVICFCNLCVFVGLYNFEFV